MEGEKQLASVLIRRARAPGGDEARAHRTSRGCGEAMQNFEMIKTTNSYVSGVSLNVFRVKICIYFE